MKKIIPFKKNIIFKTNLAEITSISLEHTLKYESDNFIRGNFVISGEYKINADSTLIDPFSYELPFDISFNSQYNLGNALIDINDFYYEIINNNVLSVNIEVLVDKIEEVLIKEPVREPIKEPIREMKEEIEEEPRCIDDELSNDINSIFDNIDESKESYSTYSIYIVREGDTIESIIERYKVTKESLELYNDLSELKINSKVLIPSNEGD